MQARLDPFSFLVVSVAGSLNQRQQQVIQYLAEENHVLREHIGARRPGFTDDQRLRLAAKARKLGRKVLSQVATVVTPETLLACALNDVDRRKPLWLERVFKQQNIVQGVLWTKIRIPRITNL